MKPTGGGGINCQITRFTRNFGRNLKSNFTNQRKGFTLAEVLITLAIIGVVAALTIPSVIKNYQKHQTEVGLKKAYTTLMQAINHSTIDNGDPKKWVFSGSYDRYLTPYLKVSKYCQAYTLGCFPTDIKFLNGESATGQITSSAPISMILQDGMALKIGPLSREMLIINVDINGFKKPNVIGHDIFLFHMGYSLAYGEGNYAYGASTHDRPILYADGYKMNLITSPYRSCTKKEGLGFSGYFCTDMIIRNGWKIPSESEYYSKSRFFSAGNGTINRTQYKYPW